MQFAKRVVPWSLACVLSLAIGCAQPTQKNVTPQKKSTPQAAHQNARLTAAPKVPQKAGGTETAEKANQEIIDRLQISAQIRKAATEQALQPATQKPTGQVCQSTSVSRQHVAKIGAIQPVPQTHKLHGAATAPDGQPNVPPQQSMPSPKPPTTPRSSKS
jgi:hypothetical protein